MKNQITNHLEFENVEIIKTFHFTQNELNSAWDKLQRRETFVKGQIFPYKVEFESNKDSGAFYEGELNIHHGPLLSVHGVIGEINSTYRDLKYFYGSYAISFRLVRPLRLEFFKEEGSIKLKMNCLVKPWFKPIWITGNNFFWRFFKKGLI